MSSQASILSIYEIANSFSEIVDVQSGTFLSNSAKTSSNFSDLLLFKLTVSKVVLDVNKDFSVSCCFTANFIPPKFLNRFEI